MVSRTRLLLAAPLAAAVLTAPLAAHADWRGHGGWHGWHGGGWGYRPHVGPGPLIAGALVGLGLGAVAAGAFAPPPPVYYAPPPPVVYAPPPAYYPPAPPAYYGGPGY